MRELTFAAIILTTLFAVLPLHADLIDVPDDYDTINDAIEHSESGDTVLVQPGTYVENVVLDVNGLVLASLFATTGDEDYIEETIIDGDSVSCVISIARELDSTTQVIGLTVQNGYQQFGGGIDVRNYSTPVIRNCVIRDNYAGNYGYGGTGGGIYVTSYAHPKLIECIIENNLADVYGGGIGFYPDPRTNSITIINSIIRGNKARYGGAAHPRSMSRLYMDHVLIEGNSAECTGGIYMYAGQATILNTTIVGNSSEDEDYAGGIHRNYTQLTITNTVIYGNSNAEIYATISEYDLDSMSFNITYSDVEGGLDGIEFGQDVDIDFYATNIGEDPGFVDPENGDYTLEYGSPCIDAGSPDTPHDPDGTISDIGALPFTNTSLLEGYVYDAESGDPLDNVTVFTAKHQETLTDSNGYWRIDPASYGVYDIGFSKYTYDSLIVDDYEVEYDEAYELNVNMKATVIDIETDPIVVDIGRGETTTRILSIGNVSEIDLEWSIELLPGEQEYELFDTFNSIALTDTNGFDDFESFVFDGEYFYISASNEWNIPHCILVTNQEGEIIRRINPMAGDDPRRVNALAYDGENLIATLDNEIYWLSTQGELLDSLHIDFRWGPDYLTYDKVDDKLFMAHPRYLFQVYDKVNQTFTDLENYDLYIFGLAYWQNAPDNYKLILVARRGNNPLFFYRMDPETCDTLAGVPVEYQHDVDCYNRDIYFADDFSGDGPLLMHLVKSADHIYRELYYIDFRYLNDVGGWLHPQDWSGITAPYDEEDLFLDFDATYMPGDSYHGILRINHNFWAPPVDIEVAINIVNDVSPQENIALPATLSLSPAYPNPFNNAVTLNYALPAGGNVELAVYDLNGRLVEILQQGAQEAGWHRQLWQAEGYATGMYLLILQAGSEVRTQKLMLIK